MSEFRFTSVARTDRGLVRQSNQDAFLNNDAKRIWAVADGMGGHSGGEIASTELIAALAGLPDTDENHLVTALRTVNENLRARSQRDHPQAKMGTTIALLSIQDDRFLCLWAGDSRVYRLRDQKLDRLTRDHRYVEDLLDLGLLKAGDMERHPHRHVVTRAVGTDADLELARCEGVVAAGDAFLLVTDGVSSLCDDEELRRAAVGRTPAGTVEKLLALCTARGAADNMTAIMVTTDAL